MKLFIVTHIDHARLAQLSAYYGCKNIKGVNELIFLWDDFYSKIPHPFGKSTVINFSEFKNTKEAPTGWIRQQFVKLQLHEFTTDESFYILDGDTLIRNEIDLEPNKMLKGSEYFIPYFDLIRDMLGLEKKCDFSFISPLLRFERKVLVKLDKYSQNRNGLGIAKTFLSLAKKAARSTKNYSFSEGEIYGTFATQLMRKEFEFIPSKFAECSIETTNKESFEYLYFNETCDLVWKGIDNWLSDDFWKYCYPKDFKIPIMKSYI